MMFLTKKKSNLSRRGKQLIYNNKLIMYISNPSVTQITYTF
jgi:hypothetical protein